MINVDLTPKAALEQFFGFRSFKGEQQAVIESVLAGKNTFVIMPTGGGKSLCYQLPALMQDGTAIIVSPLIALMKNQVDALRGFHDHPGIAHFLNSSLSRVEAQKVKKDIKSGLTKLLYVAPESLTKKDNIEFLREIPISFFAIDEAHCISEWGHDFRPEYRNLRTIFNKIDRVPVIALTATATEKVQEDILKNLGIPDADVYKASFNRPNLYYEIRQKKDVGKEIIKFIKQHEGKSGIIYCLSRKKTEEMAQMLVVNGIKALPYHAGMDAGPARRPPGPLPDGGRGRDRGHDRLRHGHRQARCPFRDPPRHPQEPRELLPGDRSRRPRWRRGQVHRLLCLQGHREAGEVPQGKPVAEQEIGKLLLQDTVSYAETSMCRRKFLLHYFGEILPGDNCGACDNCLYPKESYEATEELELLLNLVLESKERHRAKFICDLLVGNETSEVKKYKGDAMETFGKGNDRDAHFWLALIRQATVGGFLIKDIETYGNLSLSEQAKKFLKKPWKVTFTKETDYSNGDPDDDDDIITPGKGGGAADEKLMKMLQDLRKKVASQHKLPPYVIFQDPSLEEMTVRYPITIEELTQVTGVGPGKAQKYGKPFIELIADYVEENEIERAEDVLVRSVPNKSGMKVHIIQNIDKRLPLDAIARAKGLTPKALLNEMETIVMSGTRLDLSYHLNDMLETESQEEIMDYFRSSETDSIETAVEEFNGDFTEDELRLMRIKFMSEVAN
jgi:ATP-dependent DNA helicase RecQ